MSDEPVVKKKVSESQKRAFRKYEKTHLKTYSLKFNKNINSDIITKLSNVPNVQGYIKDLIRKDIEENGLE